MTLGLAADGPDSLGFLTPVSSLYVGGTPFFLKREDLTPSGSHKHRAAAGLIARWKYTGRVRAASAAAVHYVVSSSGNAAFALALQTVDTNVRLRVVTDTLSPSELIARLSGFCHVDVEVVDDPDASGSHVAARKRAVSRFLSENPQAKEIDQYADSSWGCGYTTLLRELEQQVPQLRAIIIPVGTGATLRSAVQFNLQRGRRLKIFAVDAEGSGLNGCPIGTRLFSGYGNARRTEWVRQARPHVAGWLRVPDATVVRAADRLLDCGFFLGASSAASFAAASLLAREDRLPHDGSTALVMPDGGEGYSSTLYSDEFRLRHGLPLSTP